MIFLRRLNDPVTWEMAFNLFIMVLGFGVVSRIARLYTKRLNTKEGKM